MEIITARLPQHQMMQLLWRSRTMDWIPIVKFPKTVSTSNRAFLSHVSFLKSHHKHQRLGSAFSTHVSTKELTLSESDDDEDTDHIDEETPSKGPLDRPFTSEEVKESPECLFSSFWLYVKESPSLWENPYSATTSWKPCAERRLGGISDLPNENGTNGYIFIHAEGV